MNALRINLLDTPLEPIDSTLSGTMLMGTMYVSAGAGGLAVGIHIELIAVETVDGIQRAVDPSNEDDYARVLELCGDGPLCTIKLPNMTYDYVVCAYPFAE